MAGSDFPSFLFVGGVTAGLGLALWALRPREAAAGNGGGNGGNGNGEPPPPEPPPPPPPAVVTDLSSPSPNPYFMDRLRVVGQVYSDREYTYTSIPPSLLGLEVIQTPNDDKFNNDPVIVSFTLTQPARVYVGFDPRVLNSFRPGTAGLEPQWYFGYMDTGLEILTTDPGEPRRVLWVREFPAGEVTIGGNGALSEASSNYIVIVEPM